MYLLGFEEIPLERMIYDTEEDMVTKVWYEYTHSDTENKASHGQVWVKLGDP